MLVQWGGRWLSSQKGWFNVYCYDKSGASYSQQSGYIYTTFTKTGKLWWDPGSGGQGVIYSQIDGQGPWPPLPIAGVDNCSRMIKYLVLYGARSGSYGLVDMRILDINVVADLTRHDPTAQYPDEPVQDDGTLTGKTTASPSPMGLDFVGSLAQIISGIGLYWTGPWPLLHMTYSFTPLAGSLIRLHTTIDLLFDVEIQDDSEIQMFSAGASMMGVPVSEQQHAYSVAADKYGVNVFGGGNGPAFWLAASVARLVMAILGFLTVTGLVFTAYLAATAIWIGCVAAGMVVLFLDVMNHIVHPLEAYSWLVNYALLAWIGSPFPGIRLFKVLSEVQTFSALAPKFVLATVDLFDDASVMQRYRIEKMAIISLLTSFGVGLACLAAAALLANNFQGVWSTWTL